MLSQEEINEFALFLQYEEELLRSLYPGNFIENRMEAGRSMDTSRGLTRQGDQGGSKTGGATRAQNAYNADDRKLEGISKLKANDKKPGGQPENDYISKIKSNRNETAEEPNVNKIDTEGAADVSEQPSSSKKCKTKFNDST